MKRNLTTVLFLFVASFAFAQKPMWIINSEYYPKTEYLTGFSTNKGVETPTFIKSLKASAKSELIESIKVQVSSIKALHKSEQNGIYSEDYTATTTSFANAEINGLKTEYYYDKTSQTGYALAYAEKSEVKGWYKANISFILQKIETAVNNAKQFEATGNKGKSKRTFEEILPLFDELNFSQSLLIAIEGNEPEYAQIPETLAFKSTVIQALSRLQAAIIVFVQSKETNFGKQVHILAPKLKAELSEHGCSFTDNPNEADWILNINTSTRKGSEVDGIYFSYLDAEISLIELRTGKEIYNNNFTDLKGGALDYDRAGRKAYDTGLKQITAEIVKNLEK
ncbi:hypothetical protein AGMMS50239_05270 [Bacteroidia bacterium]|nr:hypothetical protein AGMMS50239_05270 [Bacteroidia bacterium]